MQTTRVLSVLLVLLLGVWAPTVMATDDHLLITEAAVTPTDGEFLEITNPTDAAVDLTNYYLTDEFDYGLFPGLFGAGPVPDIGTTDFVVQFPPGSTIDPGQVVVIALHGAGFIATYGFAADYEMDGTDAGTTDMIQSSVGVDFSLTNSGENAILFLWDGASDLVTDVDMVNIGTPSEFNAIPDKTGLAVDGPDAGDETSTYADDGFTMPIQASDPGFGFSTKRIMDEAAGGEVTGGGNGITGDDETTEDITVTWDVDFTSPNPGVLIGGCNGVSGLTSTSDCDMLLVDLAWINEDAYSSITVLRDGVAVATLAGDAESHSDGVPAGIYEYRIAAECGNGAIATEVHQVFHCPPAKEDNLLLTEIVDGTLVGIHPVFPSPTPRWVEITNCGTETVDLQFYSVGNFNNGSEALGGGASELLAGVLGAGESFILAYDEDENTRFDEVYGFLPDQFVGGGFINGNDVLALFYGLGVDDGAGGFTGIGASEIIDIYGVIGVDGATEPWNYIEGFAIRNPGAAQGPGFDLAQWTISGEGALRGADDMTDADEIVLMQDNTFPAVHDCGAGGPNFLRGDCSGDATFNGIQDGLAALNFQFAMIPVPCIAACDASGDRVFNGLADGLHILNHQFLMGPPPAAPYPLCGSDDNGVAALTCNSHDCP